MAKKIVSPFVVVRAYSGVFFGRLIKKTGASVELADVRQVWNWTSNGLAEKVLTVGDVALRGVGTGSRVSSPCPRAIVEQVGALFFAEPEAVRVIGAIK